MHHQDAGERLITCVNEKGAKPRVDSLAVEGAGLSDRLLAVVTTVGERIIVLIVIPPPP